MKLKRIFKKKKGFNFRFGKQPKGKIKRSIYVKPKNGLYKSRKSQEAARYQYSIIQSKDTRVRTFSSKEDATIHMNKLRETQPSNRYSILEEKKPSNEWGF